MGTIHYETLTSCAHDFHHSRGGMRQRAVIVIAPALNPELIIMDEPATALDVVVQKQILQEIKELRNQGGSLGLMLPLMTTRPAFKQQRIPLINIGLLHNSSSETAAG